MDLAAISATGTAVQAGNPRRIGGTWQVFQRALDMVCTPRQRTIFPLQELEPGTGRERRAQLPRAG